MLPVQPPPVLSASTPVRRLPPLEPDRRDALFWQYPCITEGAAHARHAALPAAARMGDEAHVYLGLPWATWIDLEHKQAASPAQKAQIRHEQAGVVQRLGAWRAAQPAAGRLRVHTVCQHILWPRMLPFWREAGVTDLWLSHHPGRAPVEASGLRLHPWALYAVNVEDRTRSAGIRVDLPQAERPWLASFIGAHADHYVSDVRPRLRALAGEPGFCVELTEGWHFEEVVYREQVGGETVRPTAAKVAAMLHYNRTLSRSVFALCPAGAGPNTLRLWEAMAVGAIPVLLGPKPVLPAGGSLPPIDWDAIVLAVDDADLSTLPARLRAMPAAEREARSQRARAAYALVRAQTCF